MAEEIEGMAFSSISNLAKYYVLREFANYGGFTASEFAALAENGVPVSTNSTLDDLLEGAEKALELINKPITNMGKRKPFKKHGEKVIHVSFSDSIYEKKDVWNTLIRSRGGIKRYINALDQAKENYGPNGHFRIGAFNAIDSYYNESQENFVTSDTNRLIYEAERFIVHCVMHARELIKTNFDNVTGIKVYIDHTGDETVENSYGVAESLEYVQQSREENNESFRIPNWMNAMMESYQPFEKLFEPHLQKFITNRQGIEFPLLKADGYLNEKEVQSYSQTISPGDYDNHSSNMSQLRSDVISTIYSMSLSNANVLNRT